MVGLVGKLVEKGNQGGKLVYNLVNPLDTSWPSLLPAVMTLTGVPRAVPLRLSWMNWRRDQNPGAKLLDFFRLLSSQEEISIIVQSLIEVTKLVMTATMQLSLKLSRQFG